jgi:hypothetical protein
MKGMQQLTLLVWAASCKVCCHMGVCRHRGCGDYNMHAMCKHRGYNAGTGTVLHVERRLPAWTVLADVHARRFCAHNCALHFSKPFSSNTLQAV